MDTAVNINKSNRLNSRFNDIKINQALHLYNYIRPHFPLLVAGILLSIFATAINLVFPSIFGKLIDASFLKIGSSDTTYLNQLVLSLIGIFAISSFILTIQSFIMAQVGVNIVASLRKEVFRHLMSLDAQFFSKNRTGDIVSRLSSDIGSLQNIVSSSVSQIFTQIVALIGGMTMLFLVSPSLSMLTLITIPVIFGITFFISSRSRRASRILQDALAAANSTAEEAVSGIRIVQSFAAESYESEQYEKNISQSVKSSMALAKFQSIMAGTINFIAFGSLAVILWFGSKQVMQGYITPGKLVSFMFYALQVGITFVSLAALFSRLQEGLGASERIFEILNERSSIRNNTHINKLFMFEKEIDFRNVFFSYGRGDKQIIKNLNLTIRSGETIALVGPSGGGKSTLLNLMQRFYNLNEGSIDIDGINIEDIDLASLRSFMSIVPQESFLFSGSIEDNILYGNPSASEFEVVNAAKAANIDDFIQSLPHGYKTLVGEKGTELSTGQKQRIAIARAILKNPRIILLDEATSALDNESEAAVQDALEKLMHGRTSIIVAHRLSTIRGADRIIVIEEGEIIQNGRHDELVLQDGLYRDLYRHQFAKEKAQ